MGCRSIRRGDRHQALDLRHGVVEQVGRELLAPPVTLGERGVGRDRPGQETGAERRVRQVADPLLGQPREERVGVVAAEQRELVLHRRHRVDGRAPLDQAAVEVRDADPAREALADELGHGAPGLLDGDPVVGPVHLVEVDVVGAEAAKRGLDRRADLVRPDPRALVVGRHLREEQHLVAAPRDRPPDELLGAALAVHLGGVDPGLARVERGPDGRDHVVVRCAPAPIGPARLPGAVADDRDLRVVRAEVSRSHRGESMLGGCSSALPSARARWSCWRRTRRVHSATTTSAPSTCCWG